MAEDFAQEFYFRMREAVTGRLSRDARRIRDKAQSKSKPFDKGREPITAGGALDAMFENFRWQGKVAEAELFTRWTEVVGEMNASNSQPETLVDGTLTIRCKSTAWATQLRLMQTELLGKLNQAHPTLKIETLKLLGPDAPSWKKGPRSVPGRGPRDTYG
ncbi:MAG: hypothetical protein RLZZ164_923 [Actinomycetota bacterium]|jgi:predicted nucleic acid-binding Zn ribbon protein